MRDGSRTLRATKFASSPSCSKFRDDKADFLRNKEQEIMKGYLKSRVKWSNVSGQIKKDVKLESGITMSKRLGNPMYTLEFKQDAVKLVQEKGYTILEASSSLGVSLSALNRWIRAERGGAARSSSVLNLSEHDELIQLRKENTRLKLEREILKKAAVFFAQETK